MNIGIIGGGAVGSNIAIFLKKMGFETTLIEKNDYILGGGSIVSFINHGDGFEYYKKGHQITGQHCIDGAIVKSLVYPNKDFSTKVINKNNPIRFLVSKESNQNKTTPINLFYENAKFMKGHFQKRYEKLVQLGDYSLSHVNRILGRSPETFHSVLAPNQFSDIKNVIGGCSGSSYGVSMADYYANTMTLIEKLKVTLKTSVKVLNIQEYNSKINVICTDNSYEFDYLFICTSHNIPAISNEFSSTVIRNYSGTFFLNSMTLLNLPKTSNDNLIKKLNKINFTLQGDNGCMFACIKPPNPKESGYAAIYYPSVIGSQLFSNIYDRNYPINNPDIWNYLIKNGIATNDDTVQRTFNQACSFYPYLANYASIIKTIVRPVFNIATADSKRGSDRRVRQIGTKPVIESSSKKLAFWTSPKWTNCELVAFNAIDHFLGNNQLDVIPKNEIHGLGPKKLDLLKFLLTFNFKNSADSSHHKNCYLEKQNILT